MQKFSWFFPRVSFLYSSEKMTLVNRACGVKPENYSQEPWPLIRALGLGHGPLENEL